MEDPKVISVHFAEIALKGKNRAIFENALVENIRNSLGKSAERIVRTESRLLVYANNTKDALKSLGKVFGIAWYSPVHVVGRDIQKIKEVVLENSERIKGSSLKVETSRSDKSFPLTSPEINKEVGSELVEAGHLIDIKNPERKIFINVLRNKVLISFGRSNGLGGLPVGSGGQVLSLLSGGIDSPVASWLMMKRGNVVDFLHVHSSPTTEDVKRSKIPRIVERLQEYHPKKTRLFIAPYTEFYKKSAGINPKVELVVFRRFIFRLATKVAEEHGHLGIVSGDNIGQVASQTLENLFATTEATHYPVYRPLLTYDKQEIISLAQKIDTFALSLEEYKDCCSLVAMRHPSTRVKPETARRIEQEIGIDAIIEKTLEQVEVMEI